MKKKMIAALTGVLVTIGMMPVRADVVTVIIP